MKTLRTERGWAGHFCAASSCLFRRNTLLERGNTRIVISTVGGYKSNESTSVETIGSDRYYETMAFHAQKEGPYWEADVCRQISFKSPWALSQIPSDVDIRADEMHERVVREIMKKLQKGEHFNE